MPRFGLLTAAMALFFFCLKYHHQIPTKPLCNSQIWAAATGIVLVLFQMPLPNPHQTPTDIPRFGLTPITPPNPHAMPINCTFKMEKGVMG